jgi:hypothetical protein
MGGQQEDDDGSRHYYEVRLNSTFIKRLERHLKGDSSGKLMVNIKDTKKI